MVGVIVNVIVNINLFGMKLADEINCYINYINAILLIFIVVWIVIYIIQLIVKRAMHKKDLRILELESKVKELDASINREAAVLAQKFGSFSHVLLSVSLTDTLRKAIDNIEYVDAVQVYRVNKQIKSHKHEIEFNIEYFCGYAKANKSINAIMQQSYCVPLGIYNKIVEATENLIYIEIQCNKISEELYEKVFNESDKILINAFNDAGKDFVEALRSALEIKKRYKTFVEFLNAIDINELEKAEPEELEKIADSYMLFYILIEQVFHGYDYGIILQDTLLEVDGAIRKYKRTNFLTSLLFDNINTFMHEDNSIKSGRRYLSVPSNIVNEEFLILVTLNNSFDVHEKENIELKSDQIIEAINDVIKKSYNVTEEDMINRREKIIKRIEERIKAEFK